ncbi:MAG: nuclear transport factor 2 family protein [Calditrichaeota bacterium]|nr:nuclear transport factor 2 family protein [Calditrichota bacterium]
MIQKISVYFSLAVLILATSCVKIDEIENVKIKTEAVAKDFIQAIEQKDGNHAADLFARTADVVLIDPVNDSLVIGVDQIEATLSNLLGQIDSVKINEQEVHISPGQDLVSSRIAAIYNVSIQKAGKKSVFLALVSGYLEKSGPAWRFVQLQTSLKKKLREKISTGTQSVPTPQPKPKKEAVVPGTAAKSDSLTKTQTDTVGKSY